MAGKGIYGGDTNLEARVDSLESGDAWSNKTTGYVPVVQSDGSIAWEAASGGGGGADLSAVDQDVTIINQHVVKTQSDLVSDPEAYSEFGWRDDNYGFCVVGGSESGYTDLYVQSRADRQDYVNLGSKSGVGPYIAFRKSDGLGGGENGRISFVSEKLMQTDDVRHTVGCGPIMQAPDESLHRLLVANDGTLSTEPVV